MSGTLSRCSADSWVVSPLSPLRSSLGQTSPSAPCWPIAVPDDPRASCSVSPAWPGRTGTWRWSCPKNGETAKQMAELIKFTMENPHMQGSNQKWRLSRQRWNCNVDFEHRTWRFDPNMGLSPANLMLLTNHPCWSTAGRCLKKNILGIKYQGAGREGGKTYRLRLTTTEDWRKIFHRRMRTCE